MEPTDHDLLTQIHVRLDDLTRRLFGNGQIGVIREMDGRLHKLEKFRWLAAGAIMVGVFLLGLNGSDVLGALTP